jgi:hypothetical protein
MSEYFDASQFQGQGPDIVVPPLKAEGVSPSAPAAAAAASDHATTEGLTAPDHHPEASVEAGTSGSDRGAAHDEAGFKGAGPEKVIPVSGPRRSTELTVPLTPPVPPELPELRAIRAAQRTLLVLLVLIVLSWLRYRRSISYIYASAPVAETGNF